MAPERIGVDDEIRLSFRLIKSSGLKFHLELDDFHLSSYFLKYLCFVEIREEFKETPRVLVL